MGILQDDEGVRVDVHDQLLQLRELLALHGAEQDHLVLPLIIALPLEQGHTAVELAVDGRGDGLILLRDDERDLGIIHAVDDAVERHGGDDHGNDAVERVVEVAVDHARDDGNGQVHAEDDLADGEIAEFQLHQARDDVDAARRGVAQEHEAEAHAHEHAAEQGRHERLDGRDRQDAGEQVKENGRQHRAVERAKEEMPSDLFQAAEKQRDVDHGV